MTILVFGAGGQLGRQLQSVSKRQPTSIVLLPRTRVDIADHGAVAASIEGVKPKVVVNAAAYTKVDQAEVEPEAAFRSNRLGAAVLAETCARYGVPLVHISTDYVYDGTKASAYGELDPVSPLGVYGASKESGEREIRRRLENHVILRTAWVYGVYGNNFLKTMLSLARQRESWSVVVDQVGNPTATADLAEAILRVASRVLDGSAAWGTYHFAGRGDATWFEFASAIIGAQFTYTGKKPSILPISTAEYPTRARRPANSRLNSRKFFLAFGIEARPWQERVPEVVKALLSN